MLKKATLRDSLTFLEISSFVFLPRVKAAAKLANRYRSSYPKMSNCSFKGSEAPNQPKLTQPNTGFFPNHQIKNKIKKKSAYQL